MDLFCFMVDNGVITGLSRRGLKLLVMFERRWSICCSTLCSECSHPSYNSPAEILLSQELQDCPYHALQSPHGRFQGAGRCPEGSMSPSVWSRWVWPTSGVPAWCPLSRGSGREWQLHEESTCAVRECSLRGLGILPRAVAGQWLHQSVFNDGSGPNSASHESLLLSIHLKSVKEKHLFFFYIWPTAKKSYRFLGLGYLGKHEILLKNICGFL